MLRVAICDEDKGFINRLGQVVVQMLNGKVVLSVHCNYFSLQTFIMDEMKGNWDLIIVNTRVGTSDGIAAMQEISKQFPSILVIFYSEFLEDVKRIFLLTPIYFLIKPIEMEFLKNALFKARLMTSLREQQTITLKKNNHVVRKIEVNEIYSIESNARIITVVMATKQESFYMKMDEIEEQIPAAFIRCHQSYIINPDKVKSYSRGTIELLNGESIPISRSRAEDTCARLAKHFSSID